MNLIENSCKAMTSIIANKSSDVNLGLIEFIAENFVTGVSNVLNSSLREDNATALGPSDAVNVKIRESAIEKVRKLAIRSIYDIFDKSYNA